MVLRKIPLLHLIAVDRGFGPAAGYIPVKQGLVHNKIANIAFGKVHRQGFPFCRNKPSDVHGIQYFQFGDFNAQHLRNLLEGHFLPNVNAVNFIAVVFCLNRFDVVVSVVIHNVVDRNKGRNIPVRFFW